MRTTARQPRENRTITVDFQNEATYFQLLGDGKAFIECVLAFLLALGFQLAHKATCDGGGCLTRHSHYGLAAAGKPKPTGRVPRRESTRSCQLSREEASSGKIVMKDHVFSMRCTFWALPPRRSFRESCRAQLSRDGGEHHRRSPLHW
jgi:hypothetical protein